MDSGIFTKLLLFGSYFVSLAASSKEPPHLLQHSKMRGSFIAWPALHSIKLKCKANGSAPLQFHWLKEGKPILKRRLQPSLKTNQWYLRIRDLVPSDSGDYTCVVSNLYGEVNHTYTLQVVAKARSRPILKCGFPKNTTTKTDTTVRLRCIVVISGSLPDFRWIRWNSPPANYESSLDFVASRFTVIDPIYYRTLNMGKQGQHEVELQLTNVTDKDFGLYTCIASNHLGQDYRSAFLTREEVMKRKPTPRAIQETTMQRHKTKYGPSRGTQKNNDTFVRQSSSDDDSSEPQIPVSAFIGALTGVITLTVIVTLWSHYIHKKKQNIANPSWI